MKDIEIDFGGVTSDNVEQLRLINTTCFPITYADGFYKDMVKAKNENLSKFAYHNGFIIGAICCRIQDDNIYIMTLGVLPAYRGRNVGSRLVQSVLEFAESEESKELVSGGVKEVMLHVQISNEDAMKFYDRLGFEKGEMVENYYKRIDPPHCYVLRKKL
jgi:ribosomal protein S18 acetylase RimI-like enzyme